MLDGEGLGFIRAAFVWMMSVLLVGCSSVQPPWLTTNIDPSYPENKYILATGCGKTIRTSRLNAMESLVAQIQVRVQFSNFYASDRINLSKMTRSKNTIVANSDETLSGVTFPRQFQTPKNICVLAVLDKETAREHIVFDIHNIMSEVEVSLARSKKGGLETLKAVVRVHRLVKRIQHDQAVAAGIGVSIPDETDYLSGVIRTMAKVSSQLTFAINLSKDEWLSPQLAQALTDKGLRQVTLLGNPAFVVQGGMNWSEIQPPPGSPYFWVGYSAILSLYDVRSKQSVAESVISNRVAGETLTQAKVLAEEESQKFVRAFVGKLAN